MRVRTVVVSTACALLLGGSAGAAPQLLIPVSQDRTVAGMASASNPTLTDTDSDSDAAVGFGLFDTVVSTNATVITAASAGGGMQVSQVLGDTIVAAGWSSSDAVSHIVGSQAQATGCSRCEIVFDVSRQATYTLQGDIASFENGLASVILWGSSGSLAIFVDTETFSVSGTLVPGRYTLEIDAVGGATANDIYSQSAFATYDLLLALTSDHPGTASCFGVGCPCGNDDPGAGCTNSTGVGGLLSGTGTTSVGADDLVLDASQLPPNNSGLFYMGDSVVANPFFDGLQCALGTTFRFLNDIQNTGPAGTLILGPGIAANSAALIDPGETWHFHAWHRDASPGPGPCGTGANLTHLYSVTFTL